jgi:hypothetical protein
VDFGPSEEHHRPFEIKVVSTKEGHKMALFFCTATADDQNLLITRMDAAAGEGAAQVFVEVVAKEGHRRVRPAGEAPAAQADGFDDQGDDDLTP